jgi:hypothetical protein
MCPQNGLGAVIELGTATARPGEPLGYRIVNTGAVPLICGLPYRLERETSSGWILMNPGMAFRLMGFGVAPGLSHGLRAAIPADAPPGRYRISASVTSDHAAGTIHTSALFDVRPRLG